MQRHQNLLSPFTHTPPRFPSLNPTSPDSSNPPRLASDFSGGFSASPNSATTPSRFRLSSCVDRLRKSPSLPIAFVCLFLFVFFGRLMPLRLRGGGGSKRGMPAAPTVTPKAVIHQKYGAKACYSVEEVREAVDGGCPGLALPQQTRSVYRCSLDIPGLTVVTPGTFVRKKDAEQAAAQIALDKVLMSIVVVACNFTFFFCFTCVVAKSSSIYIEIYRVAFKFVIRYGDMHNARFS